jgi:hypothetical protein
MTASFHILSSLLFIIVQSFDELICVTENVIT